MLGAYQAIAAPGLLAVTAEAADAGAAWSEVERGLAAAGATPDAVVSVLALVKDVRTVDAARAAVEDRCAPAWTAAAVTGFGELDSMFAFSVLALR
jgi:enamine deaminase RidA (YjgF/YER057c/UK114 family)